MKNNEVVYSRKSDIRCTDGQVVLYKNELERNITIKLGYANAKIYKCSNESCPRPGCYKSYGSDIKENVICEQPGCGSKMNLIRHVSFVDCPGHDILMATMLNGAAVMDAALLLIAGNESCPQPQTSEHLAAIEIMKLQPIIILQNKVDLMRQEAAEEHYNSILYFVFVKKKIGNSFFNRINMMTITTNKVSLHDFFAFHVQMKQIGKPSYKLEILGKIPHFQLLYGIGMATCSLLMPMTEFMRYKFLYKLPPKNVLEIETRKSKYMEIFETIRMFSTFMGIVYAFSV
ncbi:hypothetical protein PCK1_000975 [Pneumocystis canis]|nr:hypothetical protein PCK1_000975 [Pneumocystis canis]